MHTSAEHRLIFFGAVPSGANGGAVDLIRQNTLQHMEVGTELIQESTRASLTGLNQTVSQSAATEFAANPAALMQSPQAAANIISNLSLGAVPILGTLFAVAGVIGLTRYGIGKAGENLSIA